MVVPVLGESKILFYKEIAAGMYHPITFVTGLLMAEIPWLVGVAFLHTLIFYPIIQLYDDPGFYFQYFLAMFLFATVFCFFGQMMSALLPNTRSASLAVSAMMVRISACYMSMSTRVWVSVFCLENKCAVAYCIHTMGEFPCDRHDGEKLCIACVCLCSFFCV
jgi:ABC-type multidrug transport system permease subunit